MKRKEPESKLNVCTEPELGDWFPNYFDGLLRPDQAKKLEKHLNECALCRGERDIWLAVLEEGFSSTSGVGFKVTRSKKA